MYTLAQLIKTQKSKNNLDPSIMATKREELIINLSVTASSYLFIVFIIYITPIFKPW